MPSIIQIAIAILSSIAIVLAAQPQRRLRMIGGVIGLIGQPFWLVATYSPDTWGLFAASVIATLGWANCIRNNLHEHPVVAVLRRESRSLHNWHATDWNTPTGCMEFCVFCGQYGRPHTTIKHKAGCPVPQASKLCPQQVKVN